MSWTSGKKTDKTKPVKSTASPAKKVKLATSPKDILAKAVCIHFFYLSTFIHIHREHLRHRLQKLLNQATSPRIPLRRMINPKSLPLPRAPMSHRMMKKLLASQPAKKGRVKKVVILLILLRATRARQIRMGTRAPRHKMFSLPRVSYRSQLLFINLNGLQVLSEKQKQSLPFPQKR